MRLPTQKNLIKERDDAIRKQERDRIMTIARGLSDNLPEQSEPRTLREAFDLFITLLEQNVNEK